MWFSKSLADVEAHEIADLNEEKNTLEKILEFVEVKKRQEQKILADIDSLTEETFKQNKHLLKKDIKEITDFLAHLKSKLGEHIEEEEVNDIVEMWKELDKNVDSPETTLPNLQSQFKKLYGIMFKDLGQLGLFISKRHEKVLAFMQETEKTEEGKMPKAEKKEKPAEEQPAEKRKPPVEGLDDMSKDIEIPKDEETLSEEELEETPEEKK